jgi:hypothetical protein
MTFLPVVSQIIQLDFLINWQYFEGKGKVVPVLFLTKNYAMKAYWGSGGIAPLIL